MFALNEGHMHVCVGSRGELILSTSTGKERGHDLKAIITLDEVLAWLPEMTEKARFSAAGNAVQKLTEDIWQEGYIFTTNPRVRILTRSGA